MFSRVKVENLIALTIVVDIKVMENQTFDSCLKSSLISECICSNACGEENNFPVTESFPSLKIST